MSDGRKYRVFISHASVDLWVARQIEAHLQQVGASSFLDALDIQRGDDFEERIIAAAADCDELVVLLTPAALRRNYVWMEIGMFMYARKRIVIIAYDVSRETIERDPSLPMVIKKLDRVDINDVDSYFRQLSGRVKASEANNG